MTDDPNRDFSGAVNQSPGMNEREGVADPTCYLNRAAVRVTLIRHGSAELLRNVDALPIFTQADIAPAPSAWQPIETAPLDRFILLYCPEDQSRWLAKWQSNEWYGVDAEHGMTRIGMGPHDVTGWRVTHWMDVPRLPSSDRGGVGVHRTTESEDAPIGQQKTRDDATSNGDRA